MLWDFFVVMNRAPNRTIKQISQDVEETSKVVREDIYDVLSSFDSREKAVVGIRMWVNDNEKILKRVYRDLTPQQLIARLTTDVDSYGVDWPDARAFKPFRPPDSTASVKKTIPDNKSSEEPDPTLLQREKKLATLIKEAQNDGKQKKVKKLMAELIEIQKLQPEIGPKFG